MQTKEKNQETVKKEKEKKKRKKKKKREREKKKREEIFIRRKTKYSLFSMLFWYFSTL